MGLELGIDKKQIEALKNAFERWTSDRVQLRFLVCLGLLAVGIFGVLNPLSGRTAAARAASSKADKLLKQAEELAFWTQEIQAFEERLAVPPDIVDWQNYVLEKLSHTSAQLIALEPKATSSRSVFKVIQMEVVAKGKSYEEFVDFIDRLEHGERIVRVEAVRVEKQQDNISLTCTVLGLVKPSALKSTKARSSKAPQGEAGDDVGAATDVVEGATAEAQAAEGLPGVAAQAPGAVPGNADSPKVAQDPPPSADSGQSPAASRADEDAENEARPGHGHDRSPPPDPRHEADGPGR